LITEERKTQKKLREVAREDRDRGRRVKIGYRKKQINGEWFIWEEGVKKRRRTAEKGYKEKVNKKVSGQRKRKSEKKHKGESRYRKITNGKSSQG
jgi:hypothetical protein